MAKKSAVERDLKRRKLGKQYSARRAKLKETIRDLNLSPEERFMAVLKLAEMPRNSAENRQRNRCAMTGRPRGHHRKFKLCRNVIRELAMHGELPGVTKSSW
jgi:small subunit ribosomal protein S14